MRVNENTKLVGEKTILVPYMEKHVQKYHQWMEDDEIRRLTGSERLTMEEEHEMQKSWREDDDKLTFIVLDRETFDRSGDEISSMVGDVNIFVNPDGCEVEVMIAEELARGRGLGREAVKGIIAYASQRLKLGNFLVKITFDNIRSLSLFESFGFVRESSSQVFEEHTLVLPETALQPFRAYWETIKEETYC